jgi:hypothetical protein
LILNRHYVFLSNKLEPDRQDRQGHGFLFHDVFHVSCQLFNSRQLFAVRENQQSATWFFHNFASRILPAADRLQPRVTAKDIAG